MRALFLSVLVMSSLVASCSDSDGTSSSNPPLTGKLYAVSSTIYGDTTSTFLTITNSLEEGTELDYANSVELPYEGFGIAPNPDGTLFAVNKGGSTVVKYVLDGSTLVQKETIDFASFGVQLPSVDAGGVQFYKPNRAFYLDSRGAQIIVWDPSTMTATKAIKVPELASRGAKEAEWSPRIRGNQLIITASFLDQVNYEIDKESLFLFFDMDSEATSTTIISEKRCNEFAASALATNGDLYFGEVGPASAINAAKPDQGSPACLVRVLAGKNEVDPTFGPLVSSFAGGREAFHLVEGAPDQALIRVLIDSYTRQPTAKPYEVYDAAVWGWSRINYTTNEPAVPVPELPVGAGGALSIRLNDRIFVTVPAADYKTTTLYDVSANPPKKSIVTRGFPYVVSQIR